MDLGFTNGVFFSYCPGMRLGIMYFIGILAYCLFIYSYPQLHLGNIGIRFNVFLYIWFWVWGIGMVDMGGNGVW